MKGSGNFAVIVRAKSTLILMVVVSLLGAGAAQAEPAKVTGSWTIEIKFNSGPTRLLRFEAQESGRGSFLLLDPSLKVWGPAKPTEARWSQADDGSVSVSGPVEFPLGNVGRDAGTLVLKGTFRAGGMTGKATLYPVGENPEDPGSKPAKEGDFKGTRGAGG